MPPSPQKSRLLAWALLLVPVLVALLYPVAQNYLRAASLLSRSSNYPASPSSEPVCWRGFAHPEIGMATR